MRSTGCPKEQMRGTGSLPKQMRAAECPNIQPIKGIGVPRNRGEVKVVPKYKWEEKVVPKYK